MENNATIHFTPYQCRIIQLWADCSSVEEAAQKLDISHHTFQTHLKRMRKKLGVRRTFEVYRYLQQRRLLN